MNVHPRIAARIRESAPVDAYVIPESLPVVSFGDPFTAKVLTVSLNPSPLELLDKKGNWLEGENRRLESLHSLGVSTPSVLSDEEVDYVYRRCVNYFKWKPYSWFKSLDSILQEALNVSYYDSSASHLDLVQWATSKVQGEILKENSETWHQLVKSDAEFLRWQLEASSAETIVVNSAGTISGLQQEGLLPELKIEEFKYPVGKTQSTLRIYSGHAYGKQVVGWNLAAAKGIPTAARPLLIEYVSRRGIYGI